MNLPPTDWPDPPLLQHYVLESAWPLALVLLAIGLALVFIARRRGHAGPAYVGCVLAALALIVPIIAYLVETGREKILQNTRQLVTAPETPFDLQTILDLTTEDAQLLEMNREQLIALAPQLEQAIKFSDLRVTNLMAIQDSEGYGRSYVAMFGRVQAGQGMGGQFKVQAILRWRHEADGRWRMHLIEQMAVNDQPVQNLRRGF